MRRIPFELPSRIWNDKRPSMMVGKCMLASSVGRIVASVQKLTGQYLPTKMLELQCPGKRGRDSVERRAITLLFSVRAWRRDVHVYGLPGRPIPTLQKDGAQLLYFH